MPNHPRIRALDLTPDGQSRAQFPDSHRGRVVKKDQENETRCRSCMRRLDTAGSLATRTSSEIDQAVRIDLANRLVPTVRRRAQDRTAILVNFSDFDFRGVASDDHPTVVYEPSGVGRGAQPAGLYRVAIERARKLLLPPVAPLVQ